MAVKNGSKVFTKIPYSPIRYLGGKSNLVNTILPLIPKHKIYVEVFGGAGNLLFAKDPLISEIEVYNDIDGDLVNFFKVLQDEEKFEKFYRKVVFTPYSRQLWREAHNTLSSETNDIERAYKFFIRFSQCFGGKGVSWGYTVRTTRGWMAQTAASWIGKIEKLPLWHERIMRVQIENDSFEKIIERYDTPDTFFYLDPPYIKDTRLSFDDYEHEMTNEQHELLVDMFLKIKGKAILSGYHHEIYDILVKNGWHVIKRVVPLLVKPTKGQKRPKRTECIYLCPKAASELKEEELFKTQEVFYAPQKGEITESNK